MLAGELVADVCVVGVADVLVEEVVLSGIVDSELEVLEVICDEDVVVIDEDGDSKLVVIESNALEVVTDEEELLELREDILVDAGTTREELELKADEPLVAREFVEGRVDNLENVVVERRTVVVELEPRLAKFI